MFTVIYRWRVKPGRQSDFMRTWRTRTDRIYDTRGSYGSRLLEEDDGTYCAIALWPSREAWAATEPALPDDFDDAQTFKDSIDEWLSTTTMSVIDDAWRIPEKVD
jgi:heme-degrading monooxygenase HmoA